MVLSVFKHLPLVRTKLKRFLSTMTSPIVQIKDGQLRGNVQQLFDNSEYYSFKGIPYGQAPVGKLRFKAPLPVQPWQGVYNATEHGSVCPQFDVYTRQLQTGSEDCLFLNVYTKSLNHNANKAVMVFIHGGAYMFGSGDDTLLGPEFLVQHDIVLVTINYRLEVFGFLCLDIPEVPGNAGMKDQVLALQWVKNNIQQFGGDANNITIFGESAGAASVTYHLISPLSKGLFNKAIAQSGTCTVDWAQTINAQDRAFRLCKVLGKDTRDPKEALDFLQSVPMKDLIRKTFKTMTKEEEHRGLPMHFVPVVEKFDNNAFLSEKPQDLLIAGKSLNIPLMIGYNNKEGMISVPMEVAKLEYRNKIPSSYIPRSICNNITADKLNEFGKRIKEFYCNGKDFNAEDVDRVCSLLSDLYFVSAIHIFTYNYAKNAESVYMYRFNFDTELNLLKSIMGFNMKGASHADELFYLFSSSFNRDTYRDNPRLKEIVDQVTMLWTDFAKNGNPTLNSPGIKWNPYTIDGKEYLNIDEYYSSGKYADRENVEFWNKLYKEAGLMHISKSKL
ncbi:esterase FE4-like [Zerene cesonia]|uniref:esterase FE4-like n=1 Tax=Zerene cesonia TaxID=33412 RepID=UPI0018E558AD|nr:esterase FE4-like [Zerene cesonia]